MTESRNYPKGNSRQIMDFNRFMSLTGNKIFLCLDKGILEICKYLLNSRGGWRTSYATEWLQYSYTMPTEEEFEVLTNAIAEANIDMASCDDIVSAIEGVQSAILSTGRSGGSGGCGCVGSGGDDVTDINDGPGEEIPEGDSYPDGFSSRAEYNTYRCKAAYYLIDNYIATLNNWAGLVGMVGGLTLAVITGLLLLSVPPVGLMVILGALGVLVGIDIGLLANLSTIAGGMETNKDDIACGVYSAASSAAAAQVIRDAAAEQVTELDLGILEPTFLQITDNLISNDQADVLATKDPTIDGMAEQVCDCGDGCDEAYSGTLNFSVGNETSLGGGEYEVVPEITTGWNCGDGYAVVIESDLLAPYKICEIEVTSGALSGTLGTFCSELDIYYTASESTTGPCDTPKAFGDDLVALVGNSYNYLTIVSCEPWVLRIKLGNV